MSLTALTLVVTAALVHATWNYFLKKANATRPFWWLVYIITGVITVPALFIYDPQALTNITPTGWLVIALSAPIHVIYGQVLQIGYKKSDYSIVYPTARGTGPLITVLCAVLILGDRPSFWGWIGIALILASIVLLAMPHKQDKQTQDLRIRAGIFWGFLTGCFIAGYSFCDAWAVQQETGLTPLSFYDACQLEGRIKRDSHHTAFAKGFSSGHRGLSLSLYSGTLCHDHCSACLCGPEPRSRHDDWGSPGRFTFARALVSDTSGRGDRDDFRCDTGWTGRITFRNKNDVLKNV